MNKKTMLLIIFLVVVVTALVILSLPRSQNIPTSSPAPQSSPKTGFPNLPETANLKQGVGIETPEFKQAEKEFIDSTPLLQKLPANSAYFDIEYKDEQHLTVLAKTANQPRDYQIAKDWFVENDIDLSKITVEYK